MNLRGMNKLLVISFGLFLSGYQLTAQEIIPHQKWWKIFG